MYPTPALYKKQLFVKSPRLLFPDYVKGAPSVMDTKGTALMAWGAFVNVTKYFLPDCFPGTHDRHAVAVSISAINCSVLSMVTYLAGAVAAGEVW